MDRVIQNKPVRIAGQVKKPNLILFFVGAEKKNAKKFPGNSFGNPLQNHW